MRRSCILTVAALVAVACLWSCGSKAEFKVASVDSAEVVIDYQKSIAQAAAEADVRVRDVRPDTVVRSHQPPYEQRYLYLVGVSGKVTANVAARLMAGAGFEPANLMELIAFRDDADRSLLERPIVALDSASNVSDPAGYTLGPCLDWNTVSYYVVSSGENGAFNNSGFDTEYRFLARR